MIGDFYKAIRPKFGGKLSEPQVLGMDALLRAGAKLPLHHMANVLAQVRKETGGYMFPIKETVMPYHKDKNPSDAEVIRRLDNAYAKGQLPWVKKPYWRSGEFGRGQLQITHEENRLNLGVKNRDDLLKPEVSARAAVDGMSKGMFTGKKLSDFDFPAALDLPPSKNPRRIVNGNDGTDKEVAKFHREFAAALEDSKWGAWDAAKTPKVTVTPPRQPTPAPSESWLVALIKRLFARG